MLSYRQLQEHASSLGIELIGITDGKELTSAKEILQKRIDHNNYTPWESPNIQERTNPSHLLPGCKSIILLALPYFVPFRPEAPLLDIGPRGRVARFAQGIDYHILLESKARKLVNCIKRETGASFSFRIQVDKTPLVERALAKKAGLNTGLNQFIFSPDYGSWISLGEILLDLPLPLFLSDDHLSCQECGKCFQACPTGAISSGQLMNPRKCISFLTQTKGTIPSSYRPLMGTWLYGCDSCQEACPLNQAALPSPLAELSHPFFPPSPALLPFLKKSNKEFSLTIGFTCAGWRGRSVLLRNAIINLGNSQDERAIKPLSQLIKHHPRPEIRGIAAWALGRIAGPKSLKTLDQALTKEKTGSVIEEIKTALDHDAVY